MEAIEQTNVGTGTILEAMGNIWTMLGKKHLRFLPVWGLSVLAACQMEPASQPSLKSLESADNTVVLERDAATPQAVIPDAVPEPAASSAANSTAYQDAVNLAAGALTLKQQATSLDDWSLIVGRWQQAIDKLGLVADGDPNHGQAQAKLTDYQQHLAQAQQRLKTLQQPPPDIPIVRDRAGTAARGGTAPTPSPQTVPQTAPQTPAGAAPIANAGSINSVVPIIERRGGTPVIDVRVNGKAYPMILDTGASHTHLPRAMANELGLQILGQAAVATASNSNAVVDVGVVDSIQVGNIQRADMPVSIGDAIPIGLLGNDVYENYDVILQVASVEFRPR